MYDDKFWEYRWELLEGAVGGWFLVRVSFALDHTSNSLRTQRVCGAIEFTAKSTEPHADPSAVRVDHGFEAGREAYRVGKVVEFPISEWWCIEHQNVCARGLPLSDTYFTDAQIARACEWIALAMEQPARIVIF